MCAYKPPMIQGGGNFGTWIKAKVSISPDKKQVKITPINKDGEPEDHFILPKKATPDLLQKGEFVLQLSKNKDEVLNFRPVNGMFEGKFIKFVASKDEKPVAKSYSKNFVKDGKNISYEYLQFTALIEITSGSFSGVQVPHNLRYNFASIDDDGKEIVGLKSATSKYTQALVEFLDVTGAWDKGAMKYSDNILPMLEKRLIQANNKFKFVLKDGWITTFFKSENPDVEESSDEDTEE